MTERKALIRRAIRRLAAYSLKADPDEAQTDFIQKYKNYAELSMAVESALYALKRSADKLLEQHPEAKSEIEDFYPVNETAYSLMKSVRDKGRLIYKKLGLNL